MSTSPNIFANPESVLALLTQQHGLGFVWLDSALNIRQMNDRAVDLLGFPGRLVGMRITEVVDELFGLDSILSELLRGQRERFSLELIEKENAAGRSYFISMSFYPYQPPDEPASLFIVCEPVRLGHLLRALNQQYIEMRLSYQEKHNDLLVDALTGLENRQSLEYTISGDAIAAMHNSHDLLVLVIQLNSEAALRAQSTERADALLRTYARALKTGFRGKIYRLDKSQFVVVIPSLTRDDFDQLRKQVQSLTEKVQQKGFPEIDVTVGIAALSETNYDPREAIQLADLRIFASKRQS